MKIIHKKSCRGFSLAELSLAVAITVILLLVVFTIATTASDALDNTNASVQRDRHADNFLEYVARDLESIVIVEGSNDAYLSLGRTLQDSPGHLGTGDAMMTNNGGLCFYTATTDRYDGKIGSDHEDDDGGGDVSCVSYNLSYTNYNNTLAGTASGSWNRNTKYSAYRVLFFPDLTYKTVLGSEDVRERMYRRSAEGMMGITGNDDDGYKQTAGTLGVRHLIAQNIFDLSCVFDIEYTQINTDGTTELASKTVFIRPQEVTGSNATKTDPTNNIGSWAQISGNGFLTDCKIDNTEMYKLAGYKLTPPTPKERLEGVRGALVSDPLLDPTIFNIKAKSITVIISVMDTTTQTLVQQRKDSAPLTRNEVLAKCRTFSRTVQLP